MRSVSYTHLPQLDAQEVEVKHRLSEGVQALSRWIDLLREAGVNEGQEIKDEDQRLNTDPESYRRTLAMKLGVDLEDLLSWYKDEIEATRANVFAIANRLSDTPVTTMTQVRALPVSYTHLITPFLVVDLRPQRFKALEMQINRPRPQITAARHFNFHMLVFA